MGPPLSRFLESVLGALGSEPSPGSPLLLQPTVLHPLGSFESVLLFEKRP